MIGWNALLQYVEKHTKTWTRDSVEEQFYSGFNFKYVQAFKKSDSKSGVKMETMLKHNNSVETCQLVFTDLKMLFVCLSLIS